MLLPKSCIYGLRASLFLASKKCPDYINIREISEELNISFHFLTKVLQQLNRSEILKSHKGPNGGVKLARPANEITFIEIVYAIDPEHEFNDCVLGLSGCGEMKPCPFHEQWSHLKKGLLTMMEESTLRDMTDRNMEFEKYCFPEYKSWGQNNF